MEERFEQSDCRSEICGRARGSPLVNFVLIARDVQERAVCVSSEVDKLFVLEGYRSITRTLHFVVCIDTRHTMHPKKRHSA
jgi:hypothetical protein